MTPTFRRPLWIEVLDVVTKTGQQVNVVTELKSTQGDRKMKTLCKYLKNDKSNVTIINLIGAMGTGKSTLAFNIIPRCFDNYSIIAGDTNLIDMNFEPVKVKV